MSPEDQVVVRQMDRAVEAIGCGMGALRRAQRLLTATNPADPADHRIAQASKLVEDALQKLAMAQASASCVSRDVAEGFETFWCGHVGPKGQPPQCGCGPAAF